MDIDLELPVVCLYGTDWEPFTSCGLALSLLKAPAPKAKASPAHTGNTSKMNPSGTNSPFFPTCPYRTISAHKIGFSFPPSHFFSG